MANPIHIRDKSRDLNCKIDNWPFSELLIETFDWLKKYLFLKF